VLKGIDMKINELSRSQQVDEVPAGGLSQLGNKLGAKILSKIPGGAAKSKAGNMAGKADLGDTANNLHKEFNTYLGTQGKKMAQATGEELSAFLQSKKHKTSATIPSGVLQKKQLDAVLMQAAKEALAGKGGVPGTAGAPVKGGAAGGAPAKGGAGGKGKAVIPDNILAQLKQMNPEQKQQLAGMLQ
jgi:hypothetical protein